MKKPKGQTSTPLAPQGAILRGKEPPPLSAGRKWMFRGVALCIPLVLLLGVELLLRMMGVGVLPDFFIKVSTEKNGEVWVENNLYTSLFFPKGLERGVHGFSFPVHKSPDAIRVFVLGESAALGDPNPTFGFSRMLETMLEKRYPEKKVEMVNLSVTAINSHVIREIARCAADKEADYWVIYMGNNEVVGPYGASTVLSSQTPPMSLIRATIALKRTYTGQLLGKIVEAFSGKDTPKRWEGMEMFLQKQIAWDDPQLKRVHENFKSNLDAIIKTGKRAGAEVLLCTVAVNDHDCPPFGSLNDPNLLPEKLAQWKEAFEKGVGCEEKGEWAEASESYLRAIEIDPSHAEVHFRLARCLEASGQERLASEHYVRAKDLDTIRFRTDSILNETIRETANENHLELLDLAKLLGAQNPTALVGKETLLEHVHFSWNGNYEAAKKISQKLCGLIEGKEVEEEKVTSEDVAQALGYTPYGEYLIKEEIKKRFSAAPFTFQAYHQETLDGLENDLKALRVYAKSSSVHSCIADIRKVLGSRPNDVDLRSYLAYLMDSAGDFKGAIEQVMMIRSLHPLHTQSEMTLASVLEKMGDLKSALRQYEYVIQFNPLLSEALLECAKLKLSVENDPEGALVYIKKALRSRYDSPEVLLLTGDICQRLEDFHSAKRYYQQTLELAPGLDEAAAKLASLYQREDKDAEALETLKRCLQQSPSGVEARLELAKLYLSKGNNTLALEQLDAILKMFPGDERALQLRSRIP